MRMVDSAPLIRLEFYDTKAQIVFAEHYPKDLVEEKEIDPMKIQSVALLVAIGLIGVTTLAPAQEQPRFGGVLKVATIGEPPTLDRDWTNASLTRSEERRVGKECRL